MKILVTGNAGFIGFHVARKLIERGDEVTGVDVVNDYYDTALKEARLEALENAASQNRARYSFVRQDLAETNAVDAIFAQGQFDRVIHLAAQAGVRYSLENPHAYTQSNLVAFTNILEAGRRHEISHLTYASTSSVYGANTKMPFAEADHADHPLQFYAATKRANELMAHAYANLYALPSTGLRFFTVYGPWGRPDMAPWKFTRAILEGEPIQVFNNGDHLRDFTFIEDIADGVIRASDDPAKADPDWDSAAPDPSASFAPWRILNIGNSDSVRLMDFIEAIEEATGKQAVKQFLPMQPGDVHATFADMSKLEAATGYRPYTPMKEGIARFVEWYRAFYNV